MMHRRKTVSSSLFPYPCTAVLTGSNTCAGVQIETFKQTYKLLKSKPTELCRLELTLAHADQYQVNWTGDCTCILMPTHP